MSFLCVFGPSAMLEGWFYEVYLRSTSTPDGLPGQVPIAFFCFLRQQQGEEEARWDGRDGIGGRTLAYG
jgi:hypothetical protein